MLRATGGWSGQKKQFKAGQNVGLYFKRSKFEKTFSMPIDKLKKELTRLIDETNDEDLLSMVKEDMAFYNTSKAADVTDNLSDKQLKELEALATEPDEKDTMTMDEFNKATDKWRTK
jgi:hypothetical protein